MGQIIKRVTIDFPAELYKAIKMVSAMKDSTIKSFVIDAVKTKLAKNGRTPNEATKKALSQSLKDESTGKLTAFSDVEDLFRHIDKISDDAQN
jgi:hypothetical protein